MKKAHTKTVTRITFSVRLPVNFHSEGQWTIAHSPLLDVSGQGKDKESALDALREATELFLISCYERGTLDAVLKDSGFEPDTGDDGEAETAGDVVEVNLPLLVARNAAQACAH